MSLPWLFGASISQLTVAQISPSRQRPCMSIVHGDARGVDGSVDFDWSLHPRRNQKINIIRIINDHPCPSGTKGEGRSWLSTRRLRVENLARRRCRKRFSPWPSAEPTSKSATLGSMVLLLNHLLGSELSCQWEVPGRKCVEGRNFSESVALLSGRLKIKAEDSGVPKFRYSRISLHSGPQGAVCSQNLGYNG